MADQFWEVKYTLNKAFELVTYNTKRDREVAQCQRVCVSTVCDREIDGSSQLCSFRFD